MRVAFQLALVLLLWLTLALHAAPTVTNIAAGDGYSLFLKSDGSLWGMGDNSFGALGDGSFNSRNRPEEIVSNNVVAVAARRNHSLFLKSDGSLWGMGDNYFGQLGDGSLNTTSKPELIVSSNVVAVAAGNDYSLFIKSNGSLWGMGDNTLGQLGGAGGATPEEIASNVVVAVAAGWDYSLFLKNDGSLWGMGSGYGTTPEEIVSNSVVAAAGGDNGRGDYTLFVKSDGSLWGMGDNYFGDLGDAGGNTPQEIVSNGVVAVAAGGAYSLFVKSDGSLWGMGFNGDGQLGDDTTNDVHAPEEIVSNSVVAVAAEGGGTSTASCGLCGPPGDLEAHTMFVKSDGSLWGVGDNYFGQLGDALSENSSVPEQIIPVPQPALAALLLAANVTALTVTHIAAGNNYSLLVKSNGSLWGMGQNSSGQLGEGTLDTAYVPERIDSGDVVADTTGGYDAEVLNAGSTVQRMGFDSLFVKSDGSLWGMGDNEGGELGNGSSSSLVPEKLAGGPWLRGSCFAGGTYRLLSSTNAALPVSQWTPVWTNIVVHRGPNNFSAPLPDDFLSHDRQGFFLLQSQ